jgi:hypothetical protein
VKPVKKEVKKSKTKKTSGKISFVDIDIQGKSEEDDDIAVEGEM